MSVHWGQVMVKQGKPGSLALLGVNESSVCLVLLGGLYGTYSLAGELVNAIFLRKGIPKALISVYFELWQFILRKQLADAQCCVHGSCWGVPKSNKEADGTGWCSGFAVHRTAAEGNV